MDLFTDLWAINHTPDRIQARQARRAIRRREIHAHIGAAVGHTRNVQAAIRWNQQTQDPADGAGMPIGMQHPGHAALLTVRRALAEFHLPTDVVTRVAGMHRLSGRGGHHMDDGVVTIEATLSSLSGINRVVDIPVRVHDGRLLDPVVIIDRGVTRAMTQHTLDDLIEQGTFTAQLPDRASMFSPPPDERRTPQRAPLIRPGIFGTAPVSKMLTRAYVQSAMQGQRVVELPTFAVARTAMHRTADVAPPRLYGSDLAWGDAPSHRDRAEMPLHPIQAGDTARLTKTVNVVGRDGQRYSLPSGASGEVQRDMEGDGRFFYVFFSDVGFATRVPGAYLSR